MNIKTKLTLNIGMLVAMIVLLVSLSVVNLQILTATEPTSPAAGPGPVSYTHLDVYKRQVSGFVRHQPHNLSSG